MAMNPNNLQTPTMPLIPAHSSEALNVAFVPITVNIPMDVDVEDPIAKAVAAAQEQLCVVMEAQDQDWKCREFTEDYWRLLRVERKIVVVSDKAGVVEMMEEVVMMIEMWYNHVSQYSQWF